MSDSFFQFIAQLDQFLWLAVAAPLIVLLGIYFTCSSGFAQVRYFPRAVSNFFALVKSQKPKSGGVHPLKTFFASLGGCVGIGNVVAVCIAVQLGGPGALLWVWIAAVIGMLVKYSELFLGMRFRVSRPDGRYDGGPMYFLRHAYRSAWVPSLVALLLCIYGVEILQFSIVTKSVSLNSGLSEYLVSGVLLALVILAGRGGVQRVGGISSWMIPCFCVMYLGMGTWVLWHHLYALPKVLGTVFSSAFTGHAAVGGFAGSTFLLTASLGIRQACYSGDLGVGYASVIHSESRIRKPEKQAALAFVEIFIDTFMICTMSILLILVTGLWLEPIAPELLVQGALNIHFPYMHFFMPLFLTLLGYSTIIAYFCVGLKCAQYLHPKHGRKAYYLYSMIMLPLFSMLPTANSLTIMSMANASLLIINLIGIFLLRREIVFRVDPVDADDIAAHGPEEAVVVESVSVAQA